MCCAHYTNDNEEVGKCPACGAPVDSEGNAVGHHCGDSPYCRTCGDAPCDGSC